MAKSTKTPVQIDRRSVKEADRRKQDTPVAVERRKQPRRRQIDPTTCEREYSNEEIEFMHAMDAYKRSSGRMFPTCSEILEVIRALGYVRVSGALTPTTAADAELPMSEATSA